MKKLVLLFTLFTILTSSLYAQKEVILRINHLLGDVEFEYNEPHMTDEGNHFKVERCEYYLSEITIIHDGGQELLIEDLWILEQAGKIASNHDLGLLDVEDIEGIIIHVGVDEPHNHLDPASWPAEHPLAPKNPSMHWGWAAGYRFFAFEGFAGETNLVNSVQFHGVGNSLYRDTEILVEAVEEDGKWVIELDADYAEAVRTIDVNPGVISHGEIWHAATVAENFSTRVFAPSNLLINTEDEEMELTMNVYPNPSSTGNVYFEAPEGHPYGTLDIYNGTGSLVAQHQVFYGGLSIVIETSGQYILRFSEDGKVLSSQKLLVK